MGLPDNLSDPSTINEAFTATVFCGGFYLHGAMAITFLMQAVVYGAVALLVSWQAALASVATK